MTIRPILHYPDKRLREVSVPVAEDEFSTEDLYALGVDLAETMLHHKAMGLSAVQIDIHKRVFVMRVPQQNPNGAPEIIVVCNPRIVTTSQRAIRAEEGCLSFPGGSAWIEAPEAIVVEFQSTSGEMGSTVFSGMFARAFAHELDHLNGKLMIDRMGMLTRRDFLRRTGT